MIDRVDHDAAGVRIWARPRASTAACGACGATSSRVHSRYDRQVADAAIAGQEEPAYVRLRGTDGNRSQIGLFGQAIDPAGPAEDDPSVDPWLDLWFYTNPIWIRPQPI